MKHLILALAALSFVWFGAAGHAEAQTCTFSASDIVMDPVDVLGTTPTLGVGSIEVSCASFLGLLSSITINIHLGDGSGGLNGSLRRMTNAQTSTGLSYELYKDAARTEVFGGTYGTHGGTPLTLTGNSVLQLLTTSGATVPIYARIPGGQSNVIPNDPSNYTSVFSATSSNVQVTYRTCNLLFVCLNRVANFSFTVRANVPANCLVVAGNLDFGAHGVLDQPVLRTSPVDVTCTAGSVFNVGLGYGIGGSTIDTRFMRDGQGNQIRYQLYKDAARTQPWGLLADGIASTFTGTGLLRGLTVYGRVPAQLTPRPGSYSDTVTVTVTY